MINQDKPKVLQSRQGQKSLDIDNRIDGRTDRQWRPVVIELGVVHGASGSAYIEIGHTKVICSIHGPHTAVGRGGVAFSDLGQIDCDFRYAPFACPISQQEQGGYGSSGISPVEKQLAQTLADALSSSIRLEKYPKSIISIHIVVLQCCGNELAAAISCASLALTDAAVEQFHTVTACTVLCSPSDRLLVDPTAEEEALGHAGSILLSCGSPDSITQLQISGRIEAEAVPAMTQLAISGCIFMQQIVNQTMKEKIAAKFTIINN